MSKEDSKEEKNQRKEIPKLEWLMAGIGFILVAGTLGYLIYSAVTQSDSPPNLYVDENYKPEPVGTNHLVKFTLINDGEENAAEVTIEGTVTDEKNETETSSVTIDYAPAHSTREGGLIFTKKPVTEPGDKRNITIRAVGYKKP